MSQLTDALRLIGTKMLDESKTPDCSAAVTAHILCSVADELEEREDE